MSVAVGSPVRILVVDDNPDHRLLTERALREEGFEVRTAGSGEEALDCLAGADLVLLDHGLPRMSGIETLAAIRERAGPPVIVVTGRGSEQVAVEALRGGAIDYVAKASGYLTSLPAVIGRAWRHHDLTRRAEEMQRLALLVTSARDRAEVFPEIARGARALLRADACWVFVTGEGELELAGEDGDGLMSPELAEAARGLLDAGRHGEIGPAAGPVELGEAAGRLLVPMLDRTDGPIGVVVVTTDEPRRFVPEEIALAETFAAFAGMAVANLNRFELERRLVTQLQNMIDMRSRLVSSVSHELRTPLTSILGFSEALREHWAALADDGRLEFIGKIHEHARELTALVDGLLDYATVEAGKVRVEIETFDLAVLARSTLESLAPMLAGRTLETDLEETVVEADPVLVRRTLNNLLTNAVKYSAPPGPIIVRTLSEAGRGRIEVVDRGPGMTSEEARRAFEPFWRGEPGRSPLRGTGLGLSLVREYARLMRGDLGVDSAPGEGSTFYVTLPLAGRAA